MKLCDTCPTPDRCNRREKCYAGKMPVEDIVLAQPEPMQVMTTDGFGWTSKPKKSKKKAK